MVKIHINCDVGEQDNSPHTVKLAEVAPYLSAVNIACGFHAGNPEIIAEAIRISIENELEIGAHPSYRDREDFGRKVIDIDHYVLFQEIIYQIGAVYTMTYALGGKLNHVKPHGALYNETAKNEQLCEVVYQAINSVSSALKVYGMPGTFHEKVAGRIGLEFVGEGFADRKYQAQDQLMSRSENGSVLTSKMAVIEQVRRLLMDHQVDTYAHGIKPLHVDTLCIHGDSAQAGMLIESIFNHFNY